MPFVVFGTEQPTDHQDSRQMIGRRYRAPYRNTDSQRHCFVRFLGKLRINRQKPLPCIFAVSKKNIYPSQKHFRKPILASPSLDTMEKNRDFGLTYTEERKQL